MASHQDTAQMDAVERRVASALLNGAARAYDFPRPRRDEGFDPELCHRCQRVNSVTGDLCVACVGEVS